MSMLSEPEVLLERQGQLGRIRLNRPQAMNALTHTMVQGIVAALTLWRDDDAVQTVLITGEGRRGLCAGGDIVALYRDAMDGTSNASARFWADEYRLNALIAEYPKPYVAFMDGIVLGGGVGISAHGSHRIVTETSAVGLPETKIGFVPDVGATWLLSRAPGGSGEYAALTAGIFGAGDAIALGLADVYVPSERLPELARALEGEPAADAIAAVAEPSPDSAIAAGRSWIDPAFDADDVDDIVLRLLASAEDAAHSAAAAIRSNSPSALAATLESLRRARLLPDLRSALRQEFRVSLAAYASPDFVEGVRARLIDKDHGPQWDPPAPVARADIAHWFEPSPDGDLIIETYEAGEGARTKER